MTGPHGGYRKDRSRDLDEGELDKAMLTERERQEILEEAARYPRPQGAAIDAMKLLQRRRGWISNETLEELGKLLQMTPAELDSVATFYNLIFRKPVGRHVILVCTSVSCWLMRYVDLLHHLRLRLGIELGETTADGRFTLLPIACLGDCDHAPAMMVDGRQYGNLTPERVDAILREYE